MIELTGELGQIKSSESAPAREVELRTYSVGEKCQAIFEMDGSWYNAKIVALAEDGYFVTFLGYGNTAQVEFNEVRPYQRPDTSLLKPGEEVSAVHSDARWYDAVLNEVKFNSALVTFKGETEPAEVDLDFVRPKSISVERKRKQCAPAPAPAPPPPRPARLQSCCAGLACAPLPAPPPQSPSTAARAGKRRSRWSLPTRCDRDGRVRLPDRGQPGPQPWPRSPMRCPLAPAVAEEPRGPTG